VKLARFRRPETAFSPSHADYRPTTNAAISWDRGHTKGWSLMGGIRQGKETKNLNMVGELTVQE
jgi:hypothetical protein